MTRQLHLNAFRAGDVRRVADPDRARTLLVSRRYADRTLRDHYGIPVQTANRGHGSQ
jgi:hypothetical protein